MCEEVTGWEQRTGCKVHVLGNHGRVVVATARQISDQFRIGQGVGIDSLQRPVNGNGGWFAILVPVAKLLAPELLREYLLSAVEALADFRLRSRQHLVIPEAPDIADLETVDQHPVQPSEVVGAPPERGRMGLLEVARHRAREMDGVLLPRPLPRRVKIEFD